MSIITNWSQADGLPLVRHLFNQSPYAGIEHSSLTFYLFDDIKKYTRITHANILTSRKNASSKSKR